MLLRDRELFDRVKLEEFMLSDKGKLFLLIIGWGEKMSHLAPGMCNCWRFAHIPSDPLSTFGLSECVTRRWKMERALRNVDRKGESDKKVEIPGAGISRKGNEKNSYLVSPSHFKQQSK
ncbi:hypothetical protein AVEN_48151-1 [Araneus ventricosus]|uniref:Uncharacterized protein n=1 Tax=Araneus ventricosus TaxID=182803 RepID=A0A4Y2F7D6_ARAVE|nr:hypothetical protein AVEN_48151-1 [Araneus ventricosus]